MHPIMRDVRACGQQYYVVVRAPLKVVHSREEDATGKGKYFDVHSLPTRLVAPGGLLLTYSC